MSNFFTTGGNNSEKQNLFIKKENKEQTKDNSLNGQYNELKNNYEQIFIEAAESIRKELDTIKPEKPCDGCSHKDCKIENKEIFAPYPPTGCKLREWQMQAITYLTGDYRTKLKAAYKAIMDKKENYECNRCGDCCRLAVSEYSYTQLKQRAMRGDKFSEDFISVFVPYYLYYHCPKIGSDNLCTIYEDRPSICRDYPHNPLKLLPSACSFNAWKNEVSHQAMLLKAKTDIIGFYKEKLG